MSKCKNCYFEHSKEEPYLSYSGEVFCSEFEEKEDDN